MSSESHRLATRRLRQMLMRQQTRHGLWEGRLSSSALATAVAAFALHKLDPERNRPRIERALDWLAAHANRDGGWGDTPRSRSNLSATLLGWSAFSVATRGRAGHDAAAAAAANWIQRQTGDLSPSALAHAVLAQYGQDRTFSAPILAMCAMAGRLGADAQAWRHVPQAPFELAAFPSGLYRWLRLPMVSYALPALIAIGLVRHRRCRTRTPGLGRLRDRLIPGLLRTLDRIQPSNGGFLEAPPLTAFVAMALCAAGEAAHAVAARAGDFLVGAMRADGSWPIDTHLKTWVTTQAVCALAAAPGARLDADSVVAVRDWLLATQGRTAHPYTGAAAGGWAWTDRPGGVPDADDSAGALCALRVLADPSDPRWPDIRTAAERGVGWLLGVQNRDGGVPTFCRGWSRLPFDRSCPDISAHALGAMLDWSDACSRTIKARVDRSIPRLLRYMARSRNPDGSWTPLWFGNQHAPRSQNRVYGTAKAMLGLIRARDSGYGLSVQSMLDSAAAWLRSSQNADGGWGAEAGVASSVEETALAVQALAGVAAEPDRRVEQGLGWIERKLEEADELPSAPIGLYFSCLWYAERLYPLIFSVAAFGAAAAREET